MTRIQSYRLGGEPVTIFSPDSSYDALEFLDWVRDKPTLGLDTETNARDLYDPDFKVRLVQFGTRDEAWALPAEGFGWAIKRVLRDRSRRFILHNAPYDTIGLHLNGFVDGRELIDRVEDSYIPCHLTDPRDISEGGIGHKLKDQAWYCIDPNVPDAEAELKQAFKDMKARRHKDGWAMIPVNHPAYTLYGGLDPMLAWRINEVQRKEVKNLGISHFLDYEHRIQQITTRMTIRGIPIDVGYTTQLQTELHGEFEYWSEVAEQLGVENVNSTQQVGAMLIEQGWEPEEFTEKSGQPKVSDDVLTKLEKGGNKLAEAVLNAKRAAKRNSSYVETMLELRDGDDRVHPLIAALRARTARMSISSPPFQQLPADDHVIRRCVVPGYGLVLVSTDYQAVEMRILAALAGVRRMRDAILEGADLHGYTAALIWGDDFTKAQRAIAKNIGFGKVYCGGIATLTRQTGTTEDEIRPAVKDYDKVFPEIRQYSQRMMDRAKRNGYRITTPFGRPLPVDDDRVYSVTNYIIQSTARDIFCTDLITMSDAGLEEYLRLPIHDEALSEVPKAEADDVAKEKELLMSWPEFEGIPLAAESDIFVNSWGDGYMKED